MQSRFPHSSLFYRSLVYLCCKGTKSKVVVEMFIGFSNCSQFNFAAICLSIPQNCYIHVLKSDLPGYAYQESVFISVHILLIVPFCKGNYILLHSCKHCVDIFKYFRYCLSLLKVLRMFYLLLTSDSQ